MRVHAISLSRAWDRGRGRQRKEGCVGTSLKGPKRADDACGGRVCVCALACVRADLCGFKMPWSLSLPGAPAHRPLPPRPVAAGCRAQNTCVCDVLARGVGGGGVCMDYRSPAASTPTHTALRGETQKGTHGADP